MTRSEDGRGVDPNQDGSAENTRRTDGSAMRLVDYLAVPYVLCADSVPGPDGKWVRRLEYLELPSCSVGTLSVPEGLWRLDRVRVRTIVRLLAAGEPVACPAAPRASADVPGELAELGLWEWLSPFLELTAEQLRAAGPPEEPGEELAHEPPAAPRHR